MKQTDRVYIAANSGARIGMAESLKKRFKVAWADPSDPTLGYRCVCIDWAVMIHCCCFIVAPVEVLLRVAYYTWLTTATAAAATSYMFKNRYVVYIDLSWRTRMQKTNCYAPTREGIAKHTKKRVC